MARRKRKRRLIWRLLRWLGGAVVVALAAVAGVAAWLSTSLPKVDGTIVVAGLSAPVTIVRDRNAIPYIRATTMNDAYFALGFAHAQDRLAQMDFMRRFGAGRLSELFAAEFAIKADTYARTLGLYDLAQRSYALMSADARAGLDAYAAGVNAYIETHHGAWPPEFYMRWPLSLDPDEWRPEPWRPADSIVWGKIMAVFLGGWGWRDELMRARLIEAIGAARTRELYPNQIESEYGATLADAGAAPGPDINWAALWNAAPAPVRRPWDASNEWVVSGERAASGLPILANDPHLRFGMPGPWYLARIDTPELSLVGATAPGVPFHILGHNGTIAWGFTTTHSDAMDLFIERVNPDDPERYLTPEGDAAFATREETLHLADGETETFTVRSTRHGPVVSDLRKEETAALLGANEVVAMAANFLRPDRTAEGVFRLNRARDWDAFTQAAAYFQAPQQNIVYADTSGNIGFYAPADIPVRAGGRPWTPVRGWTGEGDWTGWIPFADLPNVFNPPSGRIANANNRVVGPDYPYDLGDEYAWPYRFERINQMLDALDAATPRDMTKMQHDATSLMALDLLPLMLDAEFDDPRLAQAADMLRRWDGDMARERPEPLIFSAWLRELNRVLYADELDELYTDFAFHNPDVVRAILSGLTHWCDDVTTDDVTEDCADARRASLAAALDFLAARWGDDMAEWRWGEAHVAAFSHLMFGRIPGLGALLNAEVASNGDEFTVNRGGTAFGDDANPFRDVHGASFRAVYDLSNLDASLFQMAPGQSGNPYSSHWSDLAPGWRDGDYFTVPGDRALVEAEAIGVLTLAPGEAAP